MPCEKVVARILVESDCLQALNLINKVSSSLNEGFYWLSEFWGLATDFVFCPFCFVNRSLNRLADCVATKPKAFLFSSIWIGSFPSWLEVSVVKDCLVKAHVA